MNVPEAFHPGQEVICLHPPWGNPRAPGRPAPGRVYAVLRSLPRCRLLLDTLDLPLH